MRPVDKSRVYSRLFGHGGSTVPRAATRAARAAPEPSRRTRGSDPGVALGSEGGFDLGALVPGDGTVRADDRALVAFAGEDDDIALARLLEGQRDRRPPVGDQEQVATLAPAGGLGTAADRLDDRQSILAPGIFVGDDHQPAAVAGNAT